MPVEECFPIGALSEQSGVNIETIRYYERGLPDIPDRLRQQALLTENAIQARVTK